MDQDDEIVVGGSSDATKSTPTKQRLAQSNPTPHIINITY